MKKLLYLISAVVLLAILVLSIQSVFAIIPLRWEYRVVAFVAESPGVIETSRLDTGAGYISAVTPDDATLNKLGQDGWELVGSYLEMETAWPNFGKGEYVTGLQPNIRPQRLILIFKRPK